MQDLFLTMYLNKLMNKIILNFCPELKGRLYNSLVYLCWFYYPKIKKKIYLKEHTLAKIVLASFTFKYLISKYIFNLKNTDF